MGWKNVKEYYEIGHTVHITDEGLCIGSLYIPNIIVIGMCGDIKKRDDGRSNADIRRYMQAFDADPAKLKDLIQSKDTFAKSITVYTYDRANIITKQCEEINYPNVTHDGELMYENAFSIDRARVIEWAKIETSAWRESLSQRVSELLQSLNEAKRCLVECKADLDALNKLS